MSQPSDEATKGVEYKDSVEQLRDALNLARNAGTSLAIVPAIALDTALMWVDAYGSMMDSQREEHDQRTAALRAEVAALRARVALLEDISADGEGLACMVQGYSSLPARVLHEAEIVLQNIKTVRSKS